ncbi:membrane-bound PQQ-dependent dehydrogenase, glucose/quinate/shikimate family [Pantoea sp. A4]|uniref:membrane-bound PQQ-dependent dehydrogenase, glucose/quinate/shikimate family n=1 Tax=Pantoea sp. A4 TaxID=1225184 RepID=UPI00036BE2F2|nr:membrane-bound PQQ-dependent dehydrogenase, glucose/quinate/shikimate family [Pantoea sp. A4]
MSKYSFITARPVISGIVYALIGLALIFAGGKLVGLGDTTYYLIAGIALLVTGILLALGKRLALWVYAALTIYTVIWALYEVGFNGWKLLPRFDVIVFLGAWLVTPWVRRGLRGKGEITEPGPLSSGNRSVVAVVALVIVAGTLYWGLHRSDPVVEETGVADRNAPDASPDGEDNSQWHSYGGTHAADRYVPFEQLNASNVKDLKVAWHYTTGDVLPQVAKDKGIFFAFEATPLHVDNVLYLCTPRGRVQALDAQTGKRLWENDPQADLSHNTFMNCRGVSLWQAPADSGYHAADGSQTCATRIISPVLDGRIMAVDAKTGERCTDFGHNGFIDMKEGMGVVQPGFYTPTSAPLVVKNLIIEGATVDDNRALDEPSGVVRAWDAVSGQLVWSWDAARKDPNEKLQPGDQFTRGTPNAWGTYTADVKNNLVYIPTGNATPDYWGKTRRPVDNQINSSVVALNLDTGKQVWAFQTTHHDVWDLDVPVGPSLVDLPAKTGTGTIPALVQTTKRGELFVLNRLTGKPVFPIEERKVPVSGEQSDWLSPTQPYSAGLASMGPPHLKATDVWGGTMFDQLWCRIDFAQHDYQGQFTAPSVKGALGMPANDGVTDWSGGTIDLKRHLFIAPATYVAFSNRLIPRAEAEKRGLVEPVTDYTDNAPRGLKDAIAAAYGQPYVEQITAWLNPAEVPCTPPPFGTLTAIDLETGKQVWSQKFGTTRDMGPAGIPYNLPMQTGMMSLGGGVATRSGLFIIGATIDQYLRVYESATGKLLYQARLPAGAQATPSVFMGKDGKEYIVIAVGGHGELRSRSGDEVYAFALPEVPQKS